VINSAHQLADATEMIVLGTTAAQHTSYPRRAERIRRVRAIGLPLTFRDDMAVFGAGVLRTDPAAAGIASALCHIGRWTLPW
jgi:hypothetical protein